MWDDSACNSLQARSPERARCTYLIQKQCQNDAYRAVCEHTCGSCHEQQPKVCPSHCDRACVRARLGPGSLQEGVLYQRQAKRPLTHPGDTTQCGA